MTTPHPVVERYVAMLEGGLQDLGPEDRREIVQEIRDHVTDALAAGRPLDAVLTALGPADVLARAYAVESLLHPRRQRRLPRIERYVKVGALVLVGGLATVLIVIALGAIGVGFVASGAATLVIGILEWLGIALPGVQMAGFHPSVAVLLGAVLIAIGGLALVGLLTYFKFLSRTIRAVLPAREGVRS